MQHHASHRHILHTPYASFPSPSSLFVSFSGQSLETAKDFAISKSDEVTIEATTAAVEAVNMFLDVCVYFIIVVFVGFLAHALVGRNPKVRHVFSLIVRLCVSPEALSGEAGTLGNGRSKRCCCRRRRRRRNNGNSGNDSGWIGGGGGGGGQDGEEEKHGIVMVDNPYPSFRSTSTDTTLSAQAPAATSTSSPTATRTSLEAAAGHNVKHMEGKGEYHNDDDMSDISISGAGLSQASWSEDDQTSDNGGDGELSAAVNGSGGDATAAAAAPEEKGGDVLVSHQTSRRNVSHQTSRRNGSTEL